MLILDAIFNGSGYPKSDQVPAFNAVPYLKQYYA
jgi:hypothetical protein